MILTCTWLDMEEDSIEICTTFINTNTANNPIHMKMQSSHIRLNRLNTTYQHISNVCMTGTLLVLKQELPWSSDPMSTIPSEVFDATNRRSYFCIQLSKLKGSPIILLSLVKSRFCGRPFKERKQIAQTWCSIYYIINIAFLFCGGRSM